MILSAKEKQYAIVAGVLAAAFAVYELAWLPYRAGVDDIDKKVAAARDVLEQNEKATGKWRKLQPIWADITTGGLKSDESQAETQALEAVLDWSRQAGGERMLETVNRGRTTVEAGFTVLEFKVTLKGTTAQVGKFLWAIESATVPVRVADIEIKTAKEGTDDLSVSMTVSTLCMPADPERPDRPATRSGGAPTTARGGTPTTGRVAPTAMRTAGSPIGGGK